MEIRTNIRPDDGDENASRYWPDYEDNREKKEEDRTAFFIVPMSGKELRKHRHSHVQKTTRNKDVMAAMEKRSWALEVKILRERVRGIENLWSRDAQTDERKGITDVDTLISAVDSGSASAEELLDDVYDAILDISKMEEGLAKKSSSRPGSTSAETAMSKDGSAATTTGSQTKTASPSPN
jgi:hypothetical protein